MKISKSLLQAIAVGIAVAATAPACTTLIKKEEQPQTECTETCPTDCDGHHEKAGEGDGYDCPGCGMG